MDTKCASIIRYLWRRSLPGNKAHSPKKIIPSFCVIFLKNQRVCPEEEIIYWNDASDFFLFARCTHTHKIYAYLLFKKKVHIFLCPHSFYLEKVGTFRKKKFTYVIKPGHNKSTKRTIIFVHSQLFQWHSYITRLPTHPFTLFTTHKFHVVTIFYRIMPV